ncbi:trehalose-6-phosphate synthase [Pantoea sp. 1.19]|uniref:alpha,alpha-trehalose-phosphate synthase (UDP-forming) n=1 Tax=Pantoea sp. 1.19 TaxID=1925589 RepID=UPI000948C136|nr:trehalose-6-phosphate synthase [Pantoea sp. 1.19]
MSGLLLVSHHQGQQSGLAASLASIVARRGGLWIGWNGRTDASGDIAARPLHYQSGKDGDRLSFALTLDEAHGFYQQYVHQGLWPVFHSRPDLAQFSDRARRAWLQVNSLFSEAIVRYALPDEAIWLQDYHLIPCLRQLRDAGLTQRIGFFLHQPFPPAQFFTAIPDWRMLADALLCSDLIGFQTVQDMLNFMTFLESEYRPERLSARRFRIKGRLVTVGVFPMGIDCEEVLWQQESNSSQALEAQCRESLPPNIILSSGHLDDSSGIPFRLAAMARLLEQHPDYAHRATLLQLADPDSGYSHRAGAIDHQLEALCGQLNGQHGALDWYPVRCLKQPFTRNELCGLYRAARVALVTPLSAGMSMMAKVWIAAQDPQNPGVLILSQYAGAAESLSGALIVNPYDADAMAAALHSALSMPLAERRSRHASMLMDVRRHDIHWWAAQFLQRLQAGEDEEHALTLLSQAPAAVRCRRVRY